MGGGRFAAIVIGCVDTFDECERGVETRFEGVAERDGFVRLREIGVEVDKEGAARISAADSRRWMRDSDEARDC